MQKRENHIELSVSEAIIIAKLLDMAGDEFGKHGCNDLPYTFYDQCRSSEVMDLFNQFKEFNCDNDPMHEFINSVGQQDNAMMSGIGRLLGKIASSK